MSATRSHEPKSAEMLRVMIGYHIFHRNLVQIRTPDLIIIYPTIPIMLADNVIIIIVFTIRNLRLRRPLLIV